MKHIYGLIVGFACFLFQGNIIVNACIYIEMNALL